MAGRTINLSAGLKEMRKPSMTERYLVTNTTLRTLARHEKKRQSEHKMNMLIFDEQIGVVKPHNHHCT